ncbi:PucR family transcriptional regulator [Clostridium omnivorum]|uniref:Transcriptional regulator n=1 Tax=Clostridium omnivorum TaxID=1604902 RepID=A0ABQ5N452_9CLOT|nr:helix-turn-helix domain-containing protein [Clostridium sp. E14]GLC30003.1 transcriptional regulator [Clostridium sp. E14]
MYSFGSFLQDLSSSTGIRFNLFDEDGNLIYRYDALNDNDKRSQYPISLGNSKAILDIQKKYEPCVSLLKYSIENKYREIFSMREKSLIEILEGKDISLDTIAKNFPALSKGSTLFLVNVDGSRYEALSIIRELYSEQDIISLVYGDNIIVIGAFDEVEEHAESIKDSIVSDLYCKCYVSYGNEIHDVMKIGKAYEEAKECLLLGKKFDMKQETFSYNKMLFEKIVHNIDHRVKQELIDKFSNKFNMFDSELINTIEEFVNCGLNISDAARKLYVHRNTLIYRLDKIYKETGFDIRDFKEATVFIIAFLVWKESNR